MKKIILIISICLIVIAGGILTGLYIIGDKIIDETINMSIPTIPAESSVVTNEEEKNTEIIPAEPTTEISQATSSTETATATTKTNKPSTSKKPTITVEKMNEIKEEVTAQDKVSAAAMVMSKLSSDEVNLLKGMLSGGLTAEEKAKAKSIAFSNFSSKEIEEIKEMYTKYMNNK